MEGDAEPARSFPLPGLQPRARDPQTLAQCRHDLDQTDTWSLHWCTWFDGQRELDQQALREIHEGRWERARQMWRDDLHPLSLHNLAVIEHALLLSQPQSTSLWASTVKMWCSLAVATNEAGYVMVAEKLADQLIAEAEQALLKGQAEALRRTLSILEAGWPPKRLEELEMRLLGDDIQRLVLACAEIRKQLLSSENRSVPQWGRRSSRSDCIEQAIGEVGPRVLPLATFLSEAALPAGAAQYTTQREMGLLYRSISRYWRDLGRRPEQATALEEACRWAPLDVREELGPELEHIKALLEPREEEAEALTCELPQPKRRGLGSTAILGAVLVVGLIGLYCVTPRPSTMNLPALPREAVEKRINVILQENSELLARLRSLEKSRGQVKGEERDRLEKEIADIRTRNAKLLGELDQLERARRQGPPPPRGGGGGGNEGRPAQ